MESLMANTFKNQFGMSIGTSGGSSFVSSTHRSRLSEDDRAALNTRLERHFRPIFQRFVYGDEQITTQDLRQLLLIRKYRRLLPEDKLNEIMDLVNFNPGRSLTYQAFVRFICGDGGYQQSLDSTESGEESTSSSNDSWLKTIIRGTIPYNELKEWSSKYKCVPPPFVMIVLSLTHIGFYINTLINLNDTSSTRMSALDGVANSSYVSYSPSKRQEVWRFISYMLEHQGYLDLIFNIVIQLFLGIPLEMTLSSWRVIVIYLVGVLCGSLGQSISDHAVGLVGAGGGTFALLAGHICAMLFNRSLYNSAESDFEPRWRRVTCHVFTRTVFFTILGSVQIGLAVYRRFFSVGGLKIGVGSYVGGIVAGIVVYSGFMKDHKTYPWQKDGGWLALFAFLTFVGGCVIFNIVYKGYPPTEW